MSIKTKFNQPLQKKKRSTCYIQVQIKTKEDQGKENKEKQLTEDKRFKTNIEWNTRHNWTTEQNNGMKINV